MAIIKTSNPALSENTFRNLSGAGYGGSAESTGAMTLNGTVNKTGVLLVCVIATAAWTWHLYLQTHDYTYAAPLMTVGFIGGFIFAMITIFKKEWSPVTSPIYALFEGLALGGFSAMLDQYYHGIAFQAVGLTFGTLFVLLGFFGITVPAINGSGPIGIAFSLFVVAIAALNLVLDFDFIEKGVQFGAPKYMEWYGAFGIIVTLVWLYLEILILLSKMRGSRN